ncbi:subtilisin-like protease SBT4.5 [Prunus yedoensis var. nudiflora]|uniref:Subtilisin-like protease SBT4.5 n=1 Tax=Prunus yedoensis var. nudiflora TaxID=2094558 RepID=A0A315AZH4_PRUYE|nr:subtilisin-like protease SBT4.5 [Prunus yedoensis var. nudiflora]
MNDLFSPLSNQIGILERVVQKTSAANFLLTSYKRSFNGFAAKLTEQERERLAGMKEVVSVFPSRTFQLQTTRSWDFLGLNQTAKRNATVESNTIIGVIDSGISPDSESFNDEGGQNFTCNNKIIGARYYTDAGASDAVGHGTHTASTAAGNPVKDVSFYGLAQGTARGGVPSARIAAYKVCSVAGCPTEAIMKGFDDAIADGVDIITISIGAGSSAPFHQDPIAIGAFHAMEKGILTLQSAGNSGPEAGSVSSVAPWMLAVAASSTDRRIIDKIVLGNGKTIVGSSVNSFELNGTSFPLVYGKDASSQCVDSDARQCVAGCLDTNLVKGKIVLCDLAGGNAEAHQAGALVSQDYDVVKSYLKSTKRPRANILKSEAIKDDGAPVVASFSSRGPNQIVPEIIKPDISAPGIDILAAYSPRCSYHK